MLDMTGVPGGTSSQLGLLNACYMSPSLLDLDTELNQSFRRYWVCSTEAHETLLCTQCSFAQANEQDVQVDDTEVINFLLSTEIIPLCLRTMEMGSELSKTVATFIVQKILLDSVSTFILAPINPLHWPAEMLI